MLWSNEKVSNLSGDGVDELRNEACRGVVRLAEVVGHHLGRQHLVGGHLEHGHGETVYKRRFFGSKDNQNSLTNHSCHWVLCREILLNVVFLNVSIRRIGKF